MCQAPQWKKYLIPPFTDVETVALSLGTTLKYKCGPLKALSMSCDPAAPATADLAKSFFRIFQIGNKENTQFLSGSEAVRCVSYFMEEARLREWCWHDAEDLESNSRQCLSSWSPAVLELPITWDNLKSCQLISISTMSLKLFLVLSTKRSLTTR